MGVVDEWLIDSNGPPFTCVSDGLIEKLARRVLPITRVDKQGNNYNDDTVYTICTYFGPFGVELDGPAGVLEGAGKLAEFDERRRPVREEDVVARIERDRLAVERHGRLKVAVLARLVRLAHLVQEAGLAGRR